ncbi:cytosolic carboxypeptidase 3 isoform X2 [Gopherus flavomarginatus]|uniref:cytosolic carboxypeptidase 3 isoform X2 n=1 Tax=Gopherus flavomarginatus TaxID=286002 RepID=UPI0021CC23AF|nr:cytosolic carboxypeptidase 3 isoform X2 [Gopherus flavomarginatus]
MGSRGYLSRSVRMDEDPFNSFVAEDLEQCAFFTDSICDQLFPWTKQIVLSYDSGRWVPRLREPRNLYGISPAGHLSLIRWPHQCEVIRDRIEHIDWIPREPEPLYQPTGLELEPLYQYPREGTVVYLADEANEESCFMYSRVGGSYPSKQVIAQDWDNTLNFEARFESGNLQKVVKVSEFEYQLTLRTDLYTNRHTQWYYFRVTNTQAGMPYRFTIVNFTKPTSLYNHGMRPLLYSEVDAKIHRVGWQRTGDEIKYYKNNLGQDGHQYFSLTWTFQFPHDRDTCYFAHCYPYTYSNLQDYLAAISRDPVKSTFCKIRILCHSLARNIVYVLTITSPSESGKEAKHKAAVILTARVHPGETNSSWIMKGFLDYILGNSGDARLLRDTFVFKVVPMLNPDGVIVGNYRCSLVGQDLNRNYKSDLKESFPSVWYTRNMIRRVMEERDILLYCDLHGHSRKENVFMYGCDGGEQAEMPCLHQRIFPLMMSKNCPDKFSFPDCNFKVQKSKEGTGRVVMWKMGIRNSYTLEATFCGSKLGNREGTHFNTEDLESIGYHFCDALLDYCDPDKSKYYLCLKELEEMVKQQAKTNSENLYCDSDASVTDAILDKDSSTHVSDSSDSNDTAAHWLKPDTQVNSKKKCLKTKKERNSYLESLEENHTKHTQEQMRKAKMSEENFHSITKNKGTGSKNVSVYLPFSSRSNDVTKVQTSSMALHKILKEIDPMVKEAVPAVQANYTEQYLSPYFPEQGLDLDWTSVSQPLKHFISQRLFLPPAILKQMCYIGSTAGNGAISGCQLPKVMNRPKVKEKKAQRRVKLPVTTSIKQVGKCFSSERLTQGAEENVLEKNCLPLGLGESMSQDATLPKRANLYSPFFKMTSQSVEKHQRRGVTSCTEKTLTYLDRYAKSSSSREERKVKNRSPLKSSRSCRNRTTNQGANVRMIKSCQTQESLQLSLPIVPGAKDRESNEKCHEGEPQPKSFGQHRADLATCSNMKGNMARPTLSSKMILLSQHDNRETFHPASLLCAMKKTSTKGLLCNSETKAVAKRKTLEPGSQTLLTRPSSRNWVNFLSGLEIDANVVKNGTLQAKIYSHPGSIQTGHQLWEMSGFTSDTLRD